MNAKCIPFVLGMILAIGLAIGADEPNGVAKAHKDLPGGSARILYLCDGSAAMATKLDALRVELKKAVQMLAAEQSFGIMFYGGGACEALDGQLLAATAENKKKADDFLAKFKPHGNSDPIAGLRAAFAAKPEKIYFLTVGSFPKNDQVLAEIQKLNKDKKVIIN